MEIEKGDLNSTGVCSLDILNQGRVRICETVGRFSGSKTKRSLIKRSQFSGISKASACSRGILAL